MALVLGGGGALYVVDGTIMPSSADINADDVEDYTIFYKVLLLLHYLDQMVKMVLLL